MATRKPKLQREYGFGKVSIRVEVENIRNTEYSLAEFQIKFAKILAEIPNKFHNSIRLDFDHEEEWYQYESEPSRYGGMKVTYLRPETKEEEADRLEEDRKIQEANTAKEKAELARLQAKFANKT